MKRGSQERIVCASSPVDAIRQLDPSLLCINTRVAALRDSYDDPDLFAGLMAIYNRHTPDEWDVMIIF